MTQLTSQLTNVAQQPEQLPSGSRLNRWAEPQPEQLPSGSRLNRWADKPERRNSASTWKVCPPAPCERNCQTNARAPGQWIPQFVGGVAELDSALAEGDAPFIYLTTQGELPELYGAPFADMEKYSLTTGAPTCELSWVAQAPVRAVEFKRPKVRGGDWRVRVYVDTDKAQEFDGWCLDVNTASWARSMTQETNLVRVPEAHLDELVQCAKLGNAKRARELLTEITETGGIPDQFAWSALLSACAKGDLTSMRAVMGEMDKLSVAPNAHGFNAIAGAFSRAGQAANIRQMLPQMKEAGVEPNVYIFTSLVAAYGKSGRPVEASRVLSDMCAVGVQPNVATYNALISAWCKGSSEQTLPAHTALRQADEVLRQMEKAGASPDTFTYTALMAGHLHTGNPHAALAVINKMEAAGLQPDQASDAVKQAVHQALMDPDSRPLLKRSKSGSEHKRSNGPTMQTYKGSRAATGNERSQLVSQWRNCKDSQEPHETQICSKKTTEECGNWRRTGKCQYGNKCRYVHSTPQSKLIRTRTFPATKSCWRKPAEVAQVAQPAANVEDWTTTLKTMLGVEPTADGSIQPSVGSFQNGQFVCAVQGPQQALEAPQAQMQKTTSSLDDSKPSSSKSVLDCVSCPTCGNSFAANDVASFQQHQKRCANKRNKKSKCKLGKSNSGWTKVKSFNRCPPPAAAVA